MGFAAWFVGSPTGFAAGFVVDLLLRVVYALLSCLCLCLRPFGNDSLKTVGKKKVEKISVTLYKY